MDCAECECQQDGEDEPALPPAAHAMRTSPLQVHVCTFACKLAARMRVCFVCACMHGCVRIRVSVQRHLSRAVYAEAYEASLRECMAPTPAVFSEVTDGDAAAAMAQAKRGLDVMLQSHQQNVKAANNNEGQIYACSLCGRVCARVCRACRDGVHAFMCACVRACARACVRACVCSAWSVCTRGTVASAAP